MEEQKKQIAQEIREKIQELEDLGEKAKSIGIRVSVSWNNYGHYTVISDNKIVKINELINY